MTPLGRPQPAAAQAKACYRAGKCGDEDCNGRGHRPVWRQIYATVAASGGLLMPGPKTMPRSPW
jgi:hypothetical protein